MEKKEYLVEITYVESGDEEVITLKTDDLAWLMNQYQRNRLPLIWELLDIKEPDVELPYDDDECCGGDCRTTLDDVEMIQQGIKNYKNDNA